MGKNVLLLAVASVVGLVGGGSFDPMTASPEGLLYRASRNTPAFRPDMTEEEIFEKFFFPGFYLLRPEELEENQPQPTEDDSTALEHAEDDDDDDSDEVAGRTLFSVKSSASSVIKKVGKVGWNLLKRGFDFLKRKFYKFGGKRLLRRSKEYLKEDAFTLEPLTCENVTCSSCATFQLPIKIKEFKACAEMGFKRKSENVINFTVGLKIEEKNLFKRKFEVGDIANCFEFGAVEGADLALASLIGKVCVQGFELSIETNKTGKFCLALVFKRWAIGYRFCAEKLKKTQEGQKKKVKKDDKKGGNKGNGTKPAEKDKYHSEGELINKKGKWKVELNRISAGEQDGQIVSDEPLFENEAKIREQHSKKVLKE